jgi:hypothetical protein
MREAYLSMGITMGLDGGAGAREFREQGGSLSRLPKNVRFLGKWPAETDRAPEPSNGMYEFEVVTGNASYREGERFYLTHGEAQRVYRVFDDA